MTPEKSRNSGDFPQCCATDTVDEKAERQTSSPRPEQNEEVVGVQSTRRLIQSYNCICLRGVRSINAVSRYRMRTIRRPRVLNHNWPMLAVPHGVSLSTTPDAVFIGTCTGIFRLQPGPRSPAMSHPAGGVTSDRLSVTALPRPIVVVPYG